MRDTFESGMNPDNLIQNRGAPRKNRNAIRHGLTAGALPKGGSYIERETNKLRRVIENTVVAAHGEITIPQAALVQTIIRWERHAMLAQRWLRMKEDTMSHDQRLKYSAEVARASTERDRCISKLNLDSDSRSVIDAFYVPSASKDSPDIDEKAPSRPVDSRSPTEESNHTPNDSDA